MPMIIDFDLTKSLQELEGEDWGEPRAEIAAYNLVQKVYRLRRVPLEQFSGDDIRTFLGQGLGMQYMYPLALLRLQDDPWRWGNSHTGSLLRTVLMQEALPSGEILQNHPEYKLILLDICQNALDLLPTLGAFLSNYYSTEKTGGIGPEPWAPPLVERIKGVLRGEPYGDIS